MAEEAIKQETNEEETVEVTLDDKETKTETKSEEVKSPEVEVEKPEEKKQEESGDELEQYSEGVQKRINKLTARLRESERREKATMDYAKGVQKELKEMQTQSKTIDGNFVQEFKNRVTLHEEVLQKTLRDAINAGDVDAQVKTQTELAKLAQDKQTLLKLEEQRKVAKEQREEIGKETAQQPTAQPQKADPKATAWAAKNEWFGADEPMTLTAFSIHNRFVKEEGWDPQSDDYYTELDKRMRAEFPHKFGVTPQPKATGPAVTSANRAGGKTNSDKIKLSAREVAIAKKLGITNEQYARQVQKIRNERGS